MNTISAGATNACNCMGPQNGQPLCPCQMRDVSVVGGRYVRTTDLGPAVRQSKEPPMTKSAERGVTTDHNHPDLARGDGLREQAPVHVVLSPEERAKGFVRPVRDKYIHGKCGVQTVMRGSALAETYARDPKFYSGTYCVGCSGYFPVGEFTWDPDGSVVGS